MMKIRKILLILFTAVISSSVITQPTQAFTGYDWKAGLIIDDSIFIDSNSMTVDQIQDFLNKKVGTGTNGVPGQCDTNGTRMSELSSYTITRAQYAQSIGKPGPFTCLKDYYEVPKTEPGSGIPENNYGGKAIPTGAKSAAQLIWDAAQKYSISPKVLLVKLGTESAGPLTSDDWPLQSQYTYAMGAHCPDSGVGGSANCDSDYAGFSIQISEAASLLRWYLDSMNQSWWSYKKPFQNNNILWNIVESGCGGSNVYIENMATAALYTYTPYQPNQSALLNLYGKGDGCSAYGNRNFWRTFNDWFGQTTNGKFSPLYKSSSSDTIYALFDNIKYPIASFDIIQALGLKNYQVTVVPNTFLSGFSTGNTIGSTIFKKQYDPNGTIYLADDGKRYPVPISACKYNSDGSEIVSSSWSIDCFNSNTVATLPNRLVDLFTTQDIELSNMILYDNAAWKVENGKKRRMINGIFIDVLGGWGKIRWMQRVNASQVEGQLLIPSNSLVKFSDNDTIYLKTDSYLFPIPSIDNLKTWGLNDLPLYSIQGSYNSTSPLPIGNTLNGLFKDYLGNYYIINNLKKKVLLSTQQIDQVGFSTKAVSNADSYLNILQNTNNSGIFRSQNGNIFIIENGKERTIPTVYDFYNSGFKPEQIINISNTTELLFEYDGLKLSNNRLFKVYGDDTIRLSKDDSTSLRINSTNYPNLQYDKLIIVDEITGQKYPISGNYIP